MNLAQIKTARRVGVTSLLQYGILCQLYSVGRLSPSMLAAATDSHQSAISHSLNNLVRLGVIQRDKTLLDKRVTHITLTPSGKNLMETITSKA
jgi:DNA-binding MarR family transcriptional regulator